MLTLDAIVEHTSRFITTEYASLTSASAPVTWPVTPYRGTTGGTVDVATGLTYPLKAERARRNPKVALSFSYPAGSGHDHPATVVIQGLATVRDRDLVATSSRYLQSSADRFPDSFASIPNFMLRRMDWYWTRMWVEVTPIRVRWWDDGDLSVRAPRLDRTGRHRRPAVRSATDRPWRRLVDRRTPRPTGVDGRPERSSASDCPC